MVSIIPKPKSLILQPGALKLTLPLTIYGNMGTESTIDRIAAQLGDLAQINNPESQAQISLNLREETFRELGAEGYKLDITPAKINIEAARRAGLFYAWQTLRQLLPAGNGRIMESDNLTLPCLTINDKPRFPWRGFMLDEARHFFGMDTVKRVLDWLAFIKMNTFHWHLTDYQGWRIEIKKYPKLSEVGSIRAGSQTHSFLKRYRGMEMIPHQGWYTQSEVQEIIAYAAERHITIVPEFDLPGHFSAALAAYPHLSCTKEPMEVRREWGVFEDVACVGSPETRQFLKDVLDEFCTIFPRPFIHLGGDEVRTDHWETCPQCRRVKRELEVQSCADLNTFIMNELGVYLLEKGKISTLDS